MSEQYHYEYGAFLDDDTGKYWYEVGYFDCNQHWRPVLLSGVIYSSRRSAMSAGARIIDRVVWAINKRFYRNAAKNSGSAA